MSTIDLDTVRRKLDRIVKCLQRIREAQDMNVDDYLADEDFRSVMERQMELAVGAAVDLNVHLVAQSGYGTPADGFTSFYELARHLNAIPTGLARELAPAVGLRNRLVHEYEELDHAKVFDGLYDALRLFPQYVAAIEEYLKREAPED